MLNNISQYFNLGNKKQTYQTNQTYWISNTVVLVEVWEFYGKLPNDKENTKDKNLKWKVIIVWVDRPNSQYVLEFGSIDNAYYKQKYNKLKGETHLTSLRVPIVLPPSISTTYNDAPAMSKITRIVWFARSKPAHPCNGPRLLFKPPKPHCCLISL